MHAFRMTTGTSPDRLAAWAGRDDPLDEGGPARRVRLDHRTVEPDLDEAPVFITAAED